ncbi:glycoside hydrolase family 5 protein [Streptomyces piniterrae]|uniref:Glycoside hydrolase family 5 protein n=1 Tax=Streptomyces piniterrae TaxID=2571125 RepID=A0A4U0NJ73_9ACTN|nr:cellulase family glycosylhydrolase [Streptomyces piniterrae]TJZ54326.1 glycoside hydrolase family 5 protein [Streptomyces piniterrae]
MRMCRAATIIALGLALLCAAPTNIPAAAMGVTAPTAVESESTLLQSEPTAAQRGQGAAWPLPSGTVTSPDGRTHFTDRHGRVLRLRGLNLGKTDTVTEERVARVASDGFGVMRLNIQWEKVEPHRGRYDMGYLSYLDRVLGWADRHRVLVLIDWHQDVFGPAFGHNGMPAWATRTDGLPFEPNPDDWFADYFQPAVQAAFTHLYDDPDLRVAQTAAYAKVAAVLCGHRSLLGYDLFNEPFGPISGDPTNPDDQVEASAALERGRLAAMYRRLIDAVRSVDPDAWLFLEPTVLVGQGVPTSLPGFDDPRPGADRLGYAPHYYDTAVESGADWDPSGRFIENYEAAIGGYPAAHRLPVLVGEWGPPQATTPGNAELMRRQVGSMDRFASGWALWYGCRANNGGGYCAYDRDGSPAPGKEPAFAPYAPAVAGTPDTESYTPATRTYTLTLTADRTTRRAWTLLSLPATAFPDGARVSVSGAGPAVVVVADGPGRARLLLPTTRPGATVRVTASAR